MKKWLVALTFVNFVLLVPGVVQPIYSLKIVSKVNADFAQFEGVVFQKNRSILGTVKDLADTGDYLVSFLILFFSIVVPVAKSLMLLASIYIRKQNLKKKFVYIVDLIGKWSMADVFVVGIFLAFLATKDQVQERTFDVSAMGAQIKVQMGLNITSTLGTGFYFFLAYCLFSVLWVQLLKRFQKSVRTP